MSLTLYYHPLAAYCWKALIRLVARPSFKRVIEEAKAYFKLYPFEERLEARFR